MRRDSWFWRAKHTRNPEQTTSSRGHEHVRERDRAIAMKPSAGRERDGDSSLPPRPMKVSQLVEGRTEARRRMHSSESTHRAVARLDRAVVLLDQVVEVPVRARRS